MIGFDSSQMAKYPVLEEDFSYLHMLNIASFREILFCWKCIFPVWICKSQVKCMECIFFRIVSEEMVSHELIKQARNMMYSALVKGGNPKYTRDWTENKIVAMRSGRSITFQITFWNFIDKILARTAYLLGKKSSQSTKNINHNTNQSKLNRFSGRKKNRD